MEVTEVRVYVRDEPKLKAYATVTFDDCFVVRDVKVIQGSNGLFIAMPSRKKPDGTYKDLAHPLNNETRKKIEEKVIEAYKKELEKPRDVRVAEKSLNGDINKSVAEKSLDDDINKSIEQKFSTP